MSWTPPDPVREHAQGQRDVDAAIAGARSSAEQVHAGAVEYAIETGAPERCAVCGHVWIAGEMDPQIANYRFADGAAAIYVEVVSCQAKVKGCQH